MSDQEIETMRELAYEGGCMAERILVKDEIEKLQAELSTLQKSYNDLGVKFDKELERWQERDEEQKKEIDLLNAQMVNMDGAYTSMQTLLLKQEKEAYETGTKDELNKRKALEVELTKVRKTLEIATNSYERMGESKMVLIKEKMERDAVIAKAKEALKNLLNPNCDLGESIDVCREALAEIETLTKKEE